MYKFIGSASCMLQQLAGMKEKAERMMLEGYAYDEGNELVDDTHDMLCDYIDILMTAYPEKPEAGD